MHSTRSTARRPVALLENAQNFGAPTAQIEFRYYCPDTRAYHPEVAHCASDWLKVLTKLPGR